MSGQAQSPEWRFVAESVESRQCAVRLSFDRIRRMQMNKVVRGAECAPVLTAMFHGGSCLRLLVAG